MSTIPQMIKTIKPSDMGTDLDKAMEFCVKHDMSYSKMQQAETCMLLKMQEKEREIKHQRELFETRLK